jgi:hypothetical protein
MPTPTENEKRLLNELERTGIVARLLESMHADNAEAWQRADSKEKREDAWQYSRAIRRLRSKFEGILKEAAT